MEVQNRAWRRQTSSAPSRCCRTARLGADAAWPDGARHSGCRSICAGVRVLTRCAAENERVRADTIAASSKARVSTASSTKSSKPNRHQDSAGAAQRSLIHCASPGIQKSPLG